MTSARMPLLLIAGLLSGCSSIDRNLGFAPTDPQGFVLIAADGMPVDGSHSYLFTLQRFDAAGNKFTEEVRTISFSGMGAGLEGNEFSRPANHQMTLRFGGKALPAGDWALISRSDLTSAGTFNSTMVNCYALGTRVVRVVPGAVNLVSVGPVGGKSAALAEAEVADQARQVLAGYPGIVAPIKPAAVVGTVGFETGKGLFGDKNCRITEAGKFIPAS